MADEGFAAVRISRYNLVNGCIAANPFVGRGIDLFDVIDCLKELVMTQALLDALRNPAFYPHPVASIQVIETHISWVILTGHYAYKIKKPVNFGFLDFTTLEARRHFCQQELLLNQRMAPALYLEVLPITGTETAPILGGDGLALEYVLKMQEFPQAQLLAQVQARGALTPAHIDALAEQIAHFHAHTPPIAADHPLNTASAIVAPMRQNFEQIRPLLTDKQDALQLDALEAWTEHSIQRLWPLLEQRCQRGMVRECHGDLHLGNAALLDEQVVLFDCIEFNEPFRMIDVASDAAFLAMDLEDRGLQAESYRFIDAWLALLGDYEALPLLALYKAYRALVRAKVNLFRLHQSVTADEQQDILHQYRKYVRLAERYSQTPPQFLAMTCGVSAVGKSLASLRLVEALGAVRLRSDVERKRLFSARSDLYAAEVTEATYRHLHQLAQQVLAAGYSVVLDATYLKHSHRLAAQQVAEHAAVPWVVVSCSASETLIAQWLAERQAKGRDPSDATWPVVQAQLAQQEPLTAEEQCHAYALNTEHPEYFDALVVFFKQKFA